MEKFNIHDLRGSSVIQLYLDKNLIIMDPPYQRGSDIWTPETRQTLIDSVLNYYDMPKMYFRKISDLNSDKLYAVIDGKQRLQTIFDFIDGEIALSEDFEYVNDPLVRVEGLKYKDLSIKYPRLKALFDSYRLPIVVVETNDEDVIDDMFLRLNEGTPLNAAEKRNAMGGPMVKVIRDISNNVFFKEKTKISDKRYQHKDISAKLLFLEEQLSKHKKIIDTKKPYLDNFVKEYKKNKSASALSLKGETEKILKIMNQVFFEKDPLLKSNNIPIFYLLFRSAFYNQQLDLITRESLLKFNSELERNKKVATRDITKAKFEFIEFDRLSQQGTNSASSIRVRFAILADFFKIKSLEFI